MRPAVSFPPRGPLLAGLAYAGLVVLLLAIAAGTVGDLMARGAAVAEAQALLDRLEGRAPPRPGEAAGAGWTGSPLLEGPSVTVAGAALMQRVSAAVARFGGQITSSRLEVQNTPYGPGFIAVGVSLDMAQTDLQKLLYDLEAGLPFLFVDQLAVQAPGSGVAPAGGDRVQATLTVYGQWQGAR